MVVSANAAIELDDVSTPSAIVIENCGFDHGPWSSKVMLEGSSLPIRYQLKREKAGALL